MSVHTHLFTLLVDIVCPVCSHCWFTCMFKHICSHCLLTLSVLFVHIVGSHVCSHMFVHTVGLHDWFSIFTLSEMFHWYYSHTILFNFSMTCADGMEWMTFLDVWVPLVAWQHERLLKCHALINDIPWHTCSLIVWQHERLLKCHALINDIPWHTCSFDSLTAWETIEMSCPNQWHSLTNMLIW